MIVPLAMGREPWCTCGYTKFWHGAVQSSENSQHLTDWYTFAHVLDGFGFYLGLALIGRAWLLPARLTRAAALAVAWEIFENTDFVIDHYRVAALALGYRGDSMHRRLVEPAGSTGQTCGEVSHPPTPTVAAALAGPRLTHNPSRTTVDPEIGGYLGDVGWKGVGV